MNQDASFCEKVENDVLYQHPKWVGPKPKRGLFGTLKVPLSTPKVLNGTFGHQMYFWNPFLGFLEPGLAFSRVFNPYSNIFIYFLDNPNLFSNKYLIDKYSKINLDKVQIIHNFIVIQLSLLFLCKKSYFKH